MPAADADPSRLATALKVETSDPRRWGAAAVDWFLPPLCLGCKSRIARADHLCARCWPTVRFITTPRCDRLGIPLPYDTGGPQLSAAAIATPPDYDRARAAAHFAGVVRTLVHQLKYSDQLEGRRLLARWIAVAGADVLVDADLLVPVPLSRRRLFTRRFNQSALLGIELARLTGVPHAPLALARLKDTRQQVGLTAAERITNVRGAFRVPGSLRPRIAGRRVVLIDDVITTGATVNACARALKRSGAARVDVVAVALTTDYARTLEPGQ